MADTMQSLDQLSALKPAAAPETPKYIQKLDKQGRSYATGKRKDAVARVWVKPGAGKIVINTRDVETRRGAGVAKVEQSGGRPGSGPSSRLDRALPN